LLILFLLKIVNTFNFSIGGESSFNNMSADTKRRGADLKELIENGQVYEAGILQGFACNVRGAVVEGNRVGRKLGYPTANLKVMPGFVVPAQGVYVGFVKLDNRWFKSMINIGIRPTLDQHNVTVEAHILEFDRDIYGQTIEIHFIRRIRHEMRFPSLEALKMQLHSDRRKSLTIIKNLSLFPKENDRVLCFSKSGQLRLKPE